MAETRRPLSVIRSPHELAQILHVSIAEFDEILRDRSRYYRPHWLQRRSSGASRRIDEPQPFLGGLQRTIHRFLLGACRFSPNCHGGIPGHSTRVIAERHLGAAVLVRIDIADFFPSVTSISVAEALRYQGASRQVASILAKMVTRPADDGNGDFLPQGSPSSTTVANIVLTRFDDRFGRYAKTHGLKFDRWVDDIIMSGATAREAITIAIGLIRHEGFAAARRKTAIATRGRRQEALGFRVAKMVSPSTRFRASITSLIKESAGTDWPTTRRRLEGKLAFAQSCDGSFGSQLERRILRLDASQSRVSDP